MKEFNKLFNLFTVLAIIIMLLTTVAAASITVISKGRSNIYSVNETRNPAVVSGHYINCF